MSQILSSVSLMDGYFSYEKKYIKICWGYKISYNQGPIDHWDLMEYWDLIDNKKLISNDDNGLLKTDKYKHFIGILFQ